MYATHLRAMQMGFEILLKKQRFILLILTGSGRGYDLSQKQEGCCPEDCPQHPPHLCGTK